MPSISVDSDQDGSRRNSLNSAPPQPPRQGKSLMSMADGGQGSTSMDTSSLPVKIMAKMGNIRKEMTEFAALLPPLSQGIQQIIQGFEQVVPQMVADIVAGNPPGSGGAGGSGMGAAPQAGATPTAPPVQQ